MNLTLDVNGPMGVSCVTRQTFVYEGPVLRTREMPHCAAKFEASEEKYRIIYCFE